MTKKHHKKSNITQFAKKNKSRKVNSEPFVENVFNDYMKEKLLVAYGMIIVALIALATYLGVINYKDGDRYSKLVLDNQQYDSSTLPFKRGDIKDRSGTVLAYSSKVYNLIFDPAVVLKEERYKEPTLTMLTQNFDLTWHDLEVALLERKDSHYEKMLKGLTPDQVQNYKNALSEFDDRANVVGVWFEEEYIRSYPFGSLACDVLGFATSASNGELGLENYYNDELTGIDGVSYGYVNSELNLEKTVKPAVDGYNIVTTLDFSVQKIIENKIKQFNEEYSSDNTAVIVMNPNNGEIIAEASYPVFDLNNPRVLNTVYTQEELELMTPEDMTNALYGLWRNYCVSDIYEPGSTMKPFTVAAALEEGVLKGDETFQCNGSKKVLDMNIHCHNVYGHGELDVEGSIMQSCNVALMDIGAMMGKDLMSKYQNVFGFGYKTYVDLPGEDAGITTEVEHLDETDVATNSFGQNINVNMHQMVAGFASLINGGYYYEPHFLKRIETNGGEIVSTYKPTLIRQTITSDTSEKLRTYMYHTVTEGTAKRVAIDGYSIGGKTGTGETWAMDEEGRNLGYRSKTDYVISFMGFAPVDDPQFLIYVVIDNPNVPNYTGSSIPVCNLSHDILAEILPYLNVFPDYSDGATEAGTAIQPVVPVTEAETTEVETTENSAETTATGNETSTRR